MSIIARSAQIFSVAFTIEYKVFLLSVFKPGIVRTGDGDYSKNKVLLTIDE
jgi:hypothetical protein